MFAKSDPQSIDRLQRFLADSGPGARVEILSGAYAQPYAWNAGGESNIRHIAYGLTELHAVFPELVVDTYAVQEPCWTSCLPQLLRSFGYRRAVLKNSTCWGGYHAPTVDADLVHWIGPDGSRITTVPRYAVEQLVAPATTAAAQPSPAFIDRCVNAGIRHPAGTTLQDMGWPGRPWRFGMDQDAVRAMRHVTWREYVDTIAAPPAKEWKASQEDLRVGLVWGSSVLQRIAQIVRLSENRLVQAEKLASMAFVRQSKPFPGEDLKHAWQGLLWSQHHDLWIVPYNRYRNGTWASAADAKFEAIQTACRRIVDEATTSMTTRPEGGGLPDECVRVFNTTGVPRRELASVEVAASEQLRVLGPKGEELPCQPAAAADGASTGATLLFPAEIPAMGYATYRLAPARADRMQAERPLASATTQANGSVVLETDLHAVTIDPNKGGRISSLFAKELAREFVDESSHRSFNEFRGYFGSEGKWLTSVDAPAQVRILEKGPLRATVAIHGHLGPWPFVTHVSVSAGCGRIDFQTTFEFPVDGQPFGSGRRQPEQQQRFRLGEPWEPGRETTRSNRRPFYDSSFKLQALFPARLRRPALDKNAPFDVCRSSMTDTSFGAWDAIKHNVMLNWVDLIEEGGAAGLAVMTDHVTSYALTPGEPLGVVMGYAGPGIWHDHRLGRVPPRLLRDLPPHRRLGESPTLA